MSKFIGQKHTVRQAREDRDRAHDRMEATPGYRDEHFMSDHDEAREQMEYTEHMRHIRVYEERKGNMQYYRVLYDGAYKVMVKQDILKQYYECTVVDNYFPHNEFLLDFVDSTLIETYVNGHLYGDNQEQRDADNLEAWFRDGAPVDKHPTPDLPPAVSPGTSSMPPAYSKVVDGVRVTQVLSITRFGIDIRYLNQNYWLEFIRNDAGHKVPSMEVRVDNNYHGIITLNEQLAWVWDQYVGSMPLKPIIEAALSDIIYTGVMD